LFRIRQRRSIGRHPAVDRILRSLHRPYVYQ
jgi:hypothetical protein